MTNETARVNPTDTARTANFIGTRDTLVRNIDRNRVFPDQPGIAVAERQADMERAIRGIDVEKNNPEPGLKSLAEIQMKYIGGLVSPEAMETIHEAALVENVIRNEVMASLGLTVDAIRMSNDEGKTQLLRQIERETDIRMGKIAKLWQESHASNGETNGSGKITDEIKNDEVQKVLTSLLQKAENENETKAVPGVAANVYINKKDEDNTGSDSKNVVAAD